MIIDKDTILSWENKKIGFKYCYIYFISNTFGYKVIDIHIGSKDRFLYIQKQKGNTWVQFCWRYPRQNWGFHTEHILTKIK